MILEALSQWLLDEPELRKLVGERVFPHKRPEGRAGRLPCVVVVVADVDPQHDLDGDNLAEFAEIDIECYAMTAMQAATLAETIQRKIGFDAASQRTGLDGYSGDMGDHVCHAAILTGKGDSYEKPEDSSDVGAHIRTLTFEIQHDLLEV